MKMDGISDKKMDGCRKTDRKVDRSRVSRQGSGSMKCSRIEPFYLKTAIKVTRIALNGDRDIFTLSCHFYDF